METPHAFSNLGAKHRVKDPRDHLIGGAAAYNYPATIMNPVAWGAPIYFQGQRPACGAHAGTWLKVFLNRNQGVNTSENDTPRYLWINIKRDGSSPSAGTDMPTIFKNLQVYGCDAFEPLENNVTYDDADYASLNFLTQSMIANGQANTIASYAYPQDTSFEGIKQAISDFGAVILEMQLCARFWTAADGTTSWAEKDILPLAIPTPEFPIVSSHFVVAHSYDENYIYFANSFGSTWGRNGHGYFGADYMPYIQDVGVAQNPPLPVPAAVNYQQPVTKPTPQAVAAQVLPEVQQMVDEVPSVPQAQRKGFIAALESILSQLAMMLSGNPQATTSVPVSGGNGGTIDVMTYITSAFGKLDGNDYFKGFIMAVIGAVLSFIYPGLIQHSLPSLADIGYAAAIAGVGYLIKNFFTPAQTITTPTT